jgi:serine/threonine protein kinase
VIRIMTEGPERRTLGRYELIESLGRGVTTEAFRAKSFGVEGFEKVLVVKRVLPEFATTEPFVVAFLEHVQRAMRLSHANLAQVFDLGRDDGGATPSFYIATEFVAGIDLETLQRRSREGVTSLPLAAYLTLEVAKALDHAHRRRDEKLRPLGIVHGAVAPHNVIVSFDGDVKVTDFGVIRAALGLPGARPSLVQSYAASSPEQIRGEAPTSATDIFSLGALLYFLIAGRSPFLAESVEETRRKVTLADPTPLESIRDDVPAPLADLVHRALALDPEDRFASVSSLHEELLACTYACGLRASQSDLASFVEAHRGGPRVVAADTVIGALLERPLTVPPPPPENDVVFDTGSMRITSIPPSIGFGEMRHVSALVLSLREPLAEGLRERMRAAITRYGGEVFAEEASETTALFGLDRSDGRDTEAAVRCGLVLARGLDIGEVSPSVGVDAGRLRLDPQHRPPRDERFERLIASARGLSRASGRGVVLARRAAASLRGRFSLETEGSHFRATEFVQERFVDSFVGRKDELHQLAETLVRASRGEFRILTIVGDPGIGKTRLAVEMQRRLARGPFDLRTYFATCPPRGRELPYSGIVAMLRRVCGVRDGDPAERIHALEPRLRALGLDADEVAAVEGELGALAPGRMPVSTALKSAVTRMMHSLSEDAFTVFAWDDAHELDEASCELIARASSRLVSSRLAIVLAARPDPTAPYRSLTVDSELRLGEMDEADVERLVSARAGVSAVPRGLFEFLYERAGGQPMFVEELLRQLFDSGLFAVGDGRVQSLSLDDGVAVPRTLRALTAERLRRLGDDERQLFVAAAVLEPPVDAAVLAAVVGKAVPEVESIAEGLIAGGLLAHEGAGSYEFPSPLAREVVLAELDTKDLVALHRRAAQAHTRLLGEDVEEQADQIGYHLAAAGDRDGAADLYARSGLYYVATRQLDRAALDLAYALDLSDLESRSTAQIGHWLRALATAVRYVRTGPNLPALIERLVKRAEGDGVERALQNEMKIDLAYVLGALDQQLAAESLLDGGSSDGELLGGLLAARADLASSRGEFRLARRALEPLSKMTLTDSAALHRLALSRARTFGAAGDTVLAERALADAAGLAALDDPLLALDRAVVRTQLHASAGKWREAAEGAVHVASQAEELGLLYEVAASLSEQAAALVRLGERARARAAVASALSAAEEANAIRVALRCRLLLGYLANHDGAPSPSTEFADRIADAESRGWIGDALLGRYLRGRAAAEQGAIDEARSELHLAQRIALSTGNQAYANECAAELQKIG